jgi:hypothetical protein
MENPSRPAFHSSGIAQIENSPAYARAYYKASLQATNGRGSRITRGQILRDVMLDKMI